MLSYTTSIQNNPPYSPQQRDNAVASMTAPSPYGKYNQNHQDIVNSLGGKNAAQFDMASTKANTDYALDQQNAERSLVLAGLRQMSDQQQNQQSLRNTRLQNMYGLASGVLGALFK
jgi:hypothetical protein